MKFPKKPYAWARLYTLALLLFTLYVVMDTFIIPRAYVVVDAETSQSEVQGTKTASDAEEAVDGSEETKPISSPDASSDTSSIFTGEPVITDNSYSDSNISITIKEYNEYDTSIYVADIYLSSVDYLKTAFANNTYGKNITQKTSVIAAAQNAILAINGDFYGAQSKGYVIRNGTLYRDASSGSSQEDLVIYTDGSFDIISEGAVSASELLDNGALQVFSFGPGLVYNGEISVTSDKEVGKAMASNPRTAIGIIDKLHYVMVVSDGRTKASSWLTLYELAAFMNGLGVTTAYNLDGGGSSAMYFNGNVVNNPTTSGKKISERKVSDIVYIG
ncbi:MAG: phosphodiester glycosidase family protein [Lachnospiraceae bacterium]|nr:phosphodiester glycosidase family protein [Lachnospiraceae bacterium]